MSLVSLSELLEKAKITNSAVGAFSVCNLEMIKGVILAAEELSLPVILQLKDEFAKGNDGLVLGGAMVNFAKLSKTDVAVHIDRCKKIDVIQKALDLGFTSVNVDGSDLEMGECIKFTKQVKKMAELYGASVEAKFAPSKKYEGDENIYTSPEEAKMFCDETGVDALSVVIGNDFTNDNPLSKIRFDLLDDIKRIVDTPLTMNCGEYITPEMLRQSVMLGIRKISVNDEIINVAAKGVFSVCKNREEFVDFKVLQESQGEAVYTFAKKYIKNFYLQGIEESN